MKAQSEPKPVKETQEENNPKEAIQQPEKVEEANDEKIDQDFPGYPHYPAKEDILNPENHFERVDVDVEKLTRSPEVSKEYLKNIEGTPEASPDITQVDEDGEDIGTSQPSDADVTAEDLLLLGPRDGDMDMDEDEELRQRGWEPKDPKDLDVPEAEVVVKDEMEEDEENSYYSLGGDEKMNLEESDDQNNFC